MNCVFCAAWVKRGAAKTVPDKVQLSEGELASLVDTMQAAALNDDEWDSEDEEETEGASAAPVDKDGSRKRKRALPQDDEEVEGDSDESDIDKKYGMSDYDDEDDESDTGKMKLSEIAYLSGNSQKKDPYLEKDQVDSDEEDMQIQADDNLLAIGKMKKEYCGLEVFVFNESEDNCWCHHDLILPTIPLAMEWMDFDPGDDSKGNFIALGTAAPDIEIWDLDMVNTLEPAFVLAGAEKKKSKKKKVKKAITGHTDAVLDLSWNKLQRNVLASASADSTIGLWDLSKGSMVSSIQHHTEKVQAIEWHPFEAQSLASGSFDKTVKVYDCRSPNDSLKSWKLPGEVECVKWNHQDPYYFFASTDNGYVYSMDVRASDPVFTLKAHTDAIPGLELSSSLKNCLVTASNDCEMKVWDISDNKPKNVFSKDMKLGNLFFAKASPDSGTIFAFGGESDFRIVNLANNSSVVKHFQLGEIEGDVEDEDVPTIGGVDVDEPEEVAAVVQEKTKKKKKKKKAKKPDQEA